MAEKQPGYVYILTNPSFREDWVKIGKSSRPVDVRSKELDNTAVPLPFVIYATMKTVKYNEAERLVHKYIERFTNRRIRDNREFFNVKPEEALAIFEDVKLVLDDAEIVVYDGSISQTKPRPTVTANQSETTNCPNARPKPNGRHTACENFYYGFWKSFLEEYLPANPSKIFQTPNVKFFWDSFIPIAFGKGKILIYLICRKSKNKVAVQLCFSNDLDKKQFEAIIKYKEKAEKYIGQSLTWRRVDGKKNSTIDLYKKCNLDDPSEQDSIFAWYKEYTEKFIEFFKPIIDRW